MISRGALLLRPVRPYMSVRMTCEAATIEVESTGSWGRSTYMVERGFPVSAVSMQLEVSQARERVADIREQVVV